MQKNYYCTQFLQVCYIIQDLCPRNLYIELFLVYCSMSLGGSENGLLYSMGVNRALPDYIVSLSIIILPMFYA